MTAMSGDASRPENTKSSASCVIHTGEAFKRHFLVFAREWRKCGATFPKQGERLGESKSEAFRGAKTKTTSLRAENCVTSGIQEFHREFRLSISCFITRQSCQCKH